MATTISEEEFEREIRTLKNLRRRSGSSPGPGELPLDPDLPPPDAFQAGHSNLAYTSNDDVTLSVPSGGEDGSLFWVPAHLHPELAPGEFRAFLKEHTQVNPTAAAAGETGEASLSRSPSWLARSRSLSGGLGRQKSMLSRQYTPRHGDKVEEEKVPSLSRQRSARYGSGRNGDLSPTLQDLQKLEELVESAELGDDPAKMRQLLRRSLTVNTTGVHEDKASGADDDEADSPIVVPRPGSIIRRTARTKIRKGPPGEGGGFGNRRYSHSQRRNPRLGSQDSPIDGDEASPRPSEDGQWNVGSEETHSVERGSDETSEERSSESRHTSSDTKAADVSFADTSFASDDSNDEALIFDAYAHERTPSATSSASEYDGPSRSPSPNDAHADRPALSPIATPKVNDSAWYDDQRTPTQDSSMSAALHAMNLLPSSGPSDDIFQQQPPQQQPAGRQAVVRRDPSHPPRAGPPSPEKTQPPQVQVDTRPSVLGQPQIHESPVEIPTALPPGMAHPSRPQMPQQIPQQQQQPQRPSVIVAPPRVESPSPSITSTSSAKEKTKEKEKKHGLFGKKDKKDKEKDKGKKEKDRFLGSLFGSKKKSEEATSVSNFSAAGPAAAAALLGTSKSAKSLQASGSSSPTSPGFSNFARYPIHVERAVYRLSHIKLANARRPLIEQVLISNLMFWYLGIIGRNPTQNEEKKGLTNGLDRSKPEVPTNPALKGTPPKPADTGSAGVKKDDPPPPVRKGGLSKPERGRGGNAEAAYRAPTYGAQNAQMDKEIRNNSPSRESQQPPPQQQHTSPPPQQGRQPVMQQQQQQYPQGQQPRSNSSPSPARARSPPQQQQQQYPPGVAPPRAPQPYAPAGQQRPMSMSGDPRQRPMSYGPGQGAPQQMGQPRQGPPAGYQNGPRPGERPMYAPQHGMSPPSKTASNKKHGGPQPGQIFQYPGAGGQQYPRPGGGPQPGQIYSGPPQQQQQMYHQQYQGGGSQQRPQSVAGWQGPPQRLPGGSQQRMQPGSVEVPPRRTSGNSDAYGQVRPQSHYHESQTSPTQQHFYPSGNPRPNSMAPSQYQYPPPPPGQSRQPVPSGQQYPHHR